MFHVDVLMVSTPKSERTERLAYPHIAYNIHRHCTSSYCLTVYLISRRELKLQPKILRRFTWTNNFSAKIRHLSGSKHAPLFHQLPLSKQTMLRKTYPPPKTHVSTTFAAFPSHFFKAAVKIDASNPTPDIDSMRYKLAENGILISFDLATLETIIGQNITTNRSEMITAPMLCSGFYRFLFLKSMFCCEKLVGKVDAPFRIFQDNCMRSNVKRFQYGSIPKLMFLRHFRCVLD